MLDDLENHMVISRANDPTDPQNAPDDTGRCDGCREMRETEWCRVPDCRNEICLDCSRICKKCGTRICYRHAFLFAAGLCGNCVELIHGEWMDQAKDLENLRRLLAFISETAFRPEQYFPDHPVASALGAIAILAAVRSERGISEQDVLKQREVWIERLRSA